MITRSLVVLAGCVIVSATLPSAHATTPPGTPRVASGDGRALVDRYCVRCHNEKLRTAGLALDAIDVSKVSERADVWEKVVRKLRAGAMPPAGLPRPDADRAAAFVTWLETSLDAAAAAAPHAGRVAPFHRLNRAEYHNAVRDLLALDVDVASMLPPDDASYGFDNIADVLRMSPLLLERYMSAARTISRVAVGDPDIPPAVETYRVASSVNQDEHFDGLPFGTRGGLVVRHYFPVDGEYGIKVRLARSFLETINGLTEPHQIEVRLDGELLQLFTVGERRRGSGAAAEDADAVAPAAQADRGLELRIPIKSGPHAIGVAFVQKTSALVEAVKLPFTRPGAEAGDTHGQPYVGSVAVAGPFNGATAAASPSRQRIFVCRPSTAGDEPRCAKTILSTLARRAYRRPPTAAEVQTLVDFYAAGRAEGGFDAGIELGVRRLLVSPAFLFRIEKDPADALPGRAYRLSDLQLASRLSFFLWSSVPDDELLDLAARGRLRTPAALEPQVRRMLADPRADALIANFAGQWLQLRNVPAERPDRRLFPDFDDNLQQAFRRETELFLDSIIRENRSVLELITADYTFLNERLAKHYGIPDVYGDRFRRVTLGQGVRGGLLGQGSILLVTSYPNRTSPVLRGKWILENILGAPPPPPPPNVPALKDTDPRGQVLSMRERMAQHRRNVVCAACHSKMDPLGLPLENFDAIGSWRTRSESDGDIDASGALPDGTPFLGVAGLRAALLKQPEEFVTTVTEKLLTYALGRGVEYYDAPAVRRIVRDASATSYSFSSLVLGIVNSVPFQMKSLPQGAASPSRKVPTP